MSAWTTLDANRLVPKELVSAISAITGTLEDTLNALQTHLDVAANLPSLPDAPNAAKAVIDALLVTLDSLLAGGRIHVLAIPIAKTPPVSETPAVPPTLEDLQDVLDVSLGQTTSADAAAYASMVERTGGNAGFYKAFAESLMDLSDPNRPLYEQQHDAVAMATLLVGAPSYAAAVSAASTLELLVRPKGSAGSFTARTVPIPEDLTAKPVATASGTGVGVRLTWKPPTDVYQARYFPGVTITVKRYAIIRSTDARMLMARSVLDLFSTQALTAGMTSGEHTVVAVGTGRNASYLDTDAPTDKPSYYAIAWECTSREASIDTTIPFDRLSGVTKVEANTPTPSQTGTSPDWAATPSALGVFPPLENATKRLIEQARVLVAPSANPIKRLSMAVSSVKGVSARLTARASDLSADVERLSTALSRALPSLYVTRMSSETGGNAFLLAELAKRLGDTRDTSRPPFDHGEYVCGVCFVAGASRIADLAAVIAFFDSLFGPADATNPLLGVLAAIDTVVTQAEAVVFGQDMQPTSAAAADVDPLTGLSPAPATPAIADSGKPVASNDPANPAAGDTNVTPVEDLC
jgi:hypothetical protein